MPVWIVIFNQGYFLCAEPSFELLFPFDGRKCICIFFVKYQPGDIVFACKTWNPFFFMFLDSPEEIICHTDIEGSGFVCHDVNIERSWGHGEII